MKHLSQPIGTNFKMSMYSLMLMGTVMIMVSILWSIAWNELYEMLSVFLCAVAGVALLLNGVLVMNMVRKGNNADISEYREKTVLIYDRHDYAVIEDDLENTKRM